MAKPLIMSVDDDVDVANEIARILRGTNKYEVITAYSAKEALGHLAKHKIFLGLGGNRIRLIYLDIKMAGMDGLEFLEKVRKDYGHDIGITMLTAYEDEEKWDRATSGFVINYIKKPYSNDDIIATADKFLAGQGDKMTMKTFEKHIEKHDEWKREKL